MTSPLEEDPYGTSQPSANPRLVGETKQIVPAGVDFEQHDSDRSICESEASISNRSSSGKPRVAKVSKRRQQEYIPDPRQRLAAMGPEAFQKDMEACRMKRQPL